MTKTTKRTIPYAIFGGRAVAVPEMLGREEKATCPSCNGEVAAVKASTPHFRHLPGGAMFCHGVEEDRAARIHDEVRDILFDHIVENGVWSLIDMIDGKIQNEKVPTGEICKEKTVRENDREWYRPDIAVFPNYMAGSDQCLIGVEVVWKHAPEGKRMNIAQRWDHYVARIDVTEKAIEARIKDELANNIGEPAENLRSWVLSQRLRIQAPLPRDISDEMAEALGMPILELRTMYYDDYKEIIRNWRIEQEQKRLREQVKLEEENRRLNRVAVEKKEREEAILAANAERSAQIRNRNAEIRYTERSAATAACLPEDLGDIDRCAHCKGGGKVVPFLTGVNGGARAHAWLHHDCRRAFFAPIEAKVREEVEKKLLKEGA